MAGFGGYNARTYFDHMMFLMEQRVGVQASKALPDSTLYRFLNDAFRQIQRHLEVGRTLEDETIDLVDDTFSYGIPQAVIGNGITKVRVRATDGADDEDWQDLTRISIERMQNKYRIGSGATKANSESGEPSFWAIDEKNRKILLSPIPDVTSSPRTDGLSLTYRKIAAPLHRIWQPLNATAAITNAATAVTVSRAIVAGEVAVGDEFGIIETTQADGSTEDNTSPAVWYGIITVSTPTITLDRAFEQPTETAATFMCSQVSNIEQWSPGRLGFTPSLLAAGLMFEQAPVAEASEVGALWQQKAFAQIDSLPPEERGQVGVSRPPGSSMVGRAADTA